ncbi:hypothetical protein JTE90_015066 [Oedothorax gibbosus]|uniref:Chromatin target of PRMT1 protein C-terminal domain-containing protein n=1 Tax=Oedothorax gibbosus TaxID=931172 RepID=A0AAV6VS04_9ARAC|nr:hypothetical protein JTE90_015066 [Oedothorax gibbosus]
MATTPLVTKIVMKNTTKMSLNERFTAYRTQAQTVSNTFRQKIQQQRQATSANLRLAQQMANRPSVQAALKLKRRSLQQRLGGNRQPAGTSTAASNVKARLNLNPRPNTSNIQGRLGNFRGRGGNLRRRGGSFKSGVSPLVKARLGAPRGNFNNQNQPTRGNFRRRGNFQVGNRPNQNRRNQPGNQLPAARNARGGKSNRGRGGRWTAPGVAALPSREELDNELDVYMAETKGSMDAQLGQFMNEV